MSRSNYSKKPLSNKHLQDLQFAAEDLAAAAQGAPSRPSSDLQPSYSTSRRPVTPPNGDTPMPTQQNSPWNDPKFAQGRDALGRKPSASSMFRSAAPGTRSPSPASSSMNQVLLPFQNPNQGNHARNPIASWEPKEPYSIERFLDESSKKPRPVSEEIGYV
jgi:hypothetical protein